VRLYAFAYVRVFVCVLLRVCVCVYACLCTFLNSSSDVHACTCMCAVHVCVCVCIESKCVQVCVCMCCLAPLACVCRCVYVSVWCRCRGMRIDGTFKHVSMCVCVHAWHYQRHGNGDCSITVTCTTKGFSKTHEWSALIACRALRWR